MGRKRTTNKGLPRGLQLKNGRYYHVTTVAPRKWTSLGPDRAKALLEWAKLEGTEPDRSVKTFDVVAQRYELEVIPTKARRTQIDNLKELARLRAVFGRVLVEAIKPHHVRAYLDKRGQTAKARANREKALLSHVINKAREWGYTDAPNPCQGVKGFKESGRDRYVSDAEFRAVWDKADQTLRDAMDLALLTGQRPADVLKIKREDLRDGALWIVQNKTGTKRAIELTGELAKLIERINARPRDRLSAFLVQDDDGRPLGTFGLRSRFDKARSRAGVDFQFRDIRAKTASDTGDLAHSQQLLGHKKRDMTEHYVRERIGQRVAPLR
ncbi:tyrosine-type recombinase/integrase [Ideonella sp.]|uniref:tyrosine-type recombinase/integrase n=1 Tax=Ideonella sp. TaxID=1929293 RepID=UPI0035B24F1A